LQGKGQYDEASACFHKASELDPKLVWPHHRLGWILWEKGDLDGAERALREAVRLEADFHGGALDELAELLESRGNWDGAIAVYQEFLRINPKDAGAHANLGYALAGKGQVDEALACYKKAVELAPQAVPRDSVGLVYLFAHTSSRLLRQQKWAEAELLLRACLALREKVQPHPWDNHDPKSMLVEALLGQKKYAEAFAWFQKAFALDPKDATAHSNLGWALQGKGQLDGAIACYKKAIELDPKCVNAHANLADLLANAADPRFRDPVQAVAEAKKATELAPQFWMGWGNLGEAYYRTGQWQEAIANLDKGLALLKSDNGEIFFFLAMAHHRAGHKDQARKWYDKGITWMNKNAPKDAALLRYRGEAAEVLGVK
jgi:tetratricopeptide (TPR) repeat protein